MEIQLTDVEIEELLVEWKMDSVGCLRIRDPEKMKIYAWQLIGKDSFELVTQLGQPDFKYGQREKRHFCYFLEMRG